MNNQPSEIQRHSCEHVMASAIMKLWPQTKRGVGPAVTYGFYQDLKIHDYKITDADFTAIEAEMAKIKALKLPIEKIEKSVDEALEFENKRNQPYKVELLKDLKANAETKVTYYQIGEYIDLCRGPHIENTSQIGFFKLDKVAGAYWKGDENNSMLQRIYGFCFSTKEDLDKHLWQIEEAKKRDHRKLGEQLDLWTFSDKVGSGLPLFTAKGAMVRRLICEFVEGLQSQQGIEQVWTPQIAKAELFKISGHYDKYKENMFSVKSNYSNEEFFLKPMNCPQHTQIYASKPRSYKDLPIRMSDFAMLYRDEKPGELLGLSRTRSFSQDDCHIFCREDQIVLEMNKALDMTKQIMETYGFSYKYRLSLRDSKHPEKYLGDDKTWDKAEKLLEQILKDRGAEYYPGVGEATFYGPKLDLIATDSLGREWQLSTLQVDFFMPQRFELEYTDQNGQKQRPVMLHRAISGSPERLMAILLEHFNGNIPTWLSPIQAIILPISDKHLDYGQKLLKLLREQNIRSTINDNSETLGAKIRNAQLQKIPYMLIVGDKEMKNGTVGERGRSGKDYGEQKVEEFIKNIKKEIDNNTLD